MRAGPWHSPRVPRQGWRRPGPRACEPWHPCAGEQAHAQHATLTWSHCFVFFVTLYVAAFSCGTCTTNALGCTTQDTPVTARPGVANRRAGCWKAFRKAVLRAHASLHTPAWPVPCPATPSHTGTHPTREAGARSCRGHSHGSARRTTAHLAAAPQCTARSPGERGGCRSRARVSPRHWEEKGVGTAGSPPSLSQMRVVMASFHSHPAQPHLVVHHRIDQ